jgi:hypothetical protein
VKRSLLERLDRAFRVASARATFLLGRLRGFFSRKDRPMAKQASTVSAPAIGHPEFRPAHPLAESLVDGAVPLGGGSTPVPDDPAVANPLGHLRNLPGTSESDPTPGQGLPDAAPAPPAATSKGP